MRILSESASYPANAYMVITVSTLLTLLVFLPIIIDILS